MGPQFSLRMDISKAKASWGRMHGARVKQKRCDHSIPSQVCGRLVESKNQSLRFPCGAEVPKEYGEGEPLGCTQGSQERPDTVCGLRGRQSRFSVLPPTLLG